MAETTIQFRITHVSGAIEFVTTTGANETACLLAAARVKRYDRDTGKRDHVLTVEFWERLSVS